LGKLGLGPRVDVDTSREPNLDAVLNQIRKALENPQTDVSASGAQTVEVFLGGLCGYCYGRFNASTSFSGRLYQYRERMLPRRI